MCLIRSDKSILSLEIFLYYLRTLVLSVLIKKKFQKVQTHEALGTKKKKILYFSNKKTPFSENKLEVDPKA